MVISLSQRKPLPVPWGISCKSTERPQVPRIRAFWLASEPIPRPSKKQPRSPVLSHSQVGFIMGKIWNDLKLPPENVWFFGFSTSLQGLIYRFLPEIFLQEARRTCATCGRCQRGRVYISISNSYGHPNYLVPLSTTFLSTSISIFVKPHFQFPGTKVLMCTTEPLQCLKSSTVLLSSAVSSVSSARTTRARLGLGASSMALAVATVPKAARRRAKIPKVRCRGCAKRRPSGQAK